jgi:hypothetical protein
MSLWWSLQFLYNVSTMTSTMSLRLKLWKLQVSSHRQDLIQVFVQSMTKKTYMRTLKPPRPTSMYTSTPTLQRLRSLRLRSLRLPYKVYVYVYEETSLREDIPMRRPEEGKGNQGGVMWLSLRLFFVRPYCAVRWPRVRPSPLEPGTCSSPIPCITSLRITHVAIISHACLFLWTDVVAVVFFPKNTKKEPKVLRTKTQELRTSN